MAFSDDDCLTIGGGADTVRGLESPMGCLHMMRAASHSNASSAESLGYFRLG